MATRIVPADEPTGKNPRAPARTITPKPVAGLAATTERSVPALTGVLGARMGGRMLMDLFVDERSGRLVVDAPAQGGRPQKGAQKGTLFFLAGEPVHAAFPGALQSIAARLQKKGALQEWSTPPSSTSPSNTLALLARRSHPVAVLEALRDEVREALGWLLQAPLGEWQFFLDEDFAENTPLTAVNPFGFVLDELRRSLAPDVLLRMGEELALRYPEPRGGFANVTSRLRSFTGGVDLAGFVDGTQSAYEIYRLTGLDPVMGGLVLRTLADTGLVELLPSARPDSLRDRRRAHTNKLPALVQADSKQLSQLASLPGRGGVEILALYLDIKPEHDDAAILGVPPGAAPAAIERGYQQRLAELDPRAIPPGANRPYLLARSEELRAKVERAYRTLTSTQLRAGAPAAYEVLERIGEGGMAEVYRGHASDDPNKLVAIKRILPKLRDDPDFARQFLSEARLARRIQHPNVVRIYSVGKSDEDLYLAMELVDGYDLGELIRRAQKLKAKIPVDVACRIVADACGGLHAAHTAHDRTGALAPILHRDVSTQNILVSKTGDVKLTDFGIAQAFDTHDPSEAGKVQGKVPYLAPELIDGAPASVRSDVYAMAMTLYATLVKLPFSRPDGFETMRAILNDPLPRASSLRPDVPPAIDAVLLRAAAHNPEERHGSAQEFQLELEEALTAHTVDVGGWVRALSAVAAYANAPAVKKHQGETRTVPILEDVDVNDL